MNTQANVALVQEGYAAFGAGDIQKLLGLMAPDIVWDFPASNVIPWAGTFNGPAGVGKFFSAIMEYSEPQLFEPLHYLASDDRVVVLGRERFRAKPTGRVWQCEWAHVLTVRNGKIAAFREYTDTAAMARAFGDT
jgi:ketosteroid isomerase-like protein